MLYRFATATVAISLMAAPVAASVPQPVVGKVPSADISDDQALGCLYRLVVLNNLLNDNLKKSDVSAKDRETSNSLEDKTSRGVTFYATLIYSRPWIANRQKQTVDQVVAQGAESSDTSSAMSIACLERSLQAQTEVLKAAIGK